MEEYLQLIRVNLKRMMRLFKRPAIVFLAAVLACIPVFQSRRAMNFFADMHGEMTGSHALESGGAFWPELYTTMTECAKAAFQEKKEARNKAEHPSMNVIVTEENVQETGSLAEPVLEITEIASAVPDIRKMEEPPAFSDVREMEEPSVVPDVKVMEETPALPDVREMEEPPVIPDVEIKQAVSPVVEKQITGTLGNMEADHLAPEVKNEEEAAAPISGFLVDEEGMIYGVVPGLLDISEDVLELPSEGCTGIRRGAFTGTDLHVIELWIPANIVTVEEGALAGLDSLEWIEAEEGNPGCVSMEGLLYDGTGTVLLAFPAGRVGAYPVMPFVTRIGSGAFAGTSLSKLDLWNCKEMEIGEKIFGETSGNGITIRLPRESKDTYIPAFAGYDAVLQ